MSNLGCFFFKTISENLVNTIANTKHYSKLAFNAIWKWCENELLSLIGAYWKRFINGQSCAFFISPFKISFVSLFVII